MKTIILSEKDSEFLEAHLNLKSELVITPEQQREAIIRRMKDASRKYLRLAVKLGLVQREPCEVCKDKRSQAHHTNYARPLEVKWLCQKHHKARHRKEKIKLG